MGKFLTVARIEWGARNMLSFVRRMRYYFYSNYFNNSGMFALFWVVLGILMSE